MFDIEIYIDGLMEDVFVSDAQWLMIATEIQRLTLIYLWLEEEK